LKKLKVANKKFRENEMARIKISTSNKVISAIAIAIGSLAMMSCTQPQNQALKDAKTNAIVPVKTSTSENSQANPVAKADSTKQTSRKQPKVGTVKRMVNGDLMCYVTLADENNVEYEVGADFNICAKEQTYLNKKVRLFYEVVSVNDCQGAEPCGKTRNEFIVTKMQLIGQENSGNQSNSQTLSNGEWTITIGNKDSWSGVNGTGNLSYRGCDSKGNCINLTGGRVTCRAGVCTMGWTNGNYLYTIAQPIDNPDRPENHGSSTILTVRQGSKVILRSTGFSVVSPDAAPKL
jgi:hypothetical protein